MENELIQVAGFTISESVTSITDIILAIISFILVARIEKRCNESFFNNSWRLFFLFMGISTGIGAIAHGSRIEVGENIFNWIWMAMNFSCSISVFFALKATIKFTHANSLLNKIMNFINYASLIVFIGMTILTNNFEIFKIHAAIGLLLIFITHIVAYFKNHVGSGSIVLGMLLSFSTVFIHTEQISISNWFNYKDISHVIMMISLIMIYNGIFLMSQNLKLSIQRLRVR